MIAFLDSNILLYSVDQAEDPEKRTKARELLERPDVVLSVQVLNEFLWRSTRPNKGPRLSTEEALGFVRRWRKHPIEDVTIALFDEAINHLKRHKFAWWDCLIIAAARAQGCDVLYTEDMQDGRIIDGLRIVNPFRDL